MGIGIFGEEEFERQARRRTSDGIAWNGGERGREEEE